MAETSKTKTALQWADSRARDEAAARQFGYSILRRVFIEPPSAEFAEMLNDPEVSEAFPYRSASKSVEEGFEVIHGHLSEDSAHSTEGILTLQDDYNQLFIGPGKLPCPPWEAVYRSEKRRVFQKETMAVRRAYEAYELQPEKFKREPDDHIALELDFMGKLCEYFGDHVKDKKYAKARNILNNQVEFLDNHLLKWVPQFVADIQGAAWTELYKGAASVLEGFLVKEREYIEEMVHMIDNKIMAEKKKATADKAKSKTNAVKASS